MAERDAKLNPAGLPLADAARLLSAAGAPARRTAISHRATHFRAQCLARVPDEQRW